MLHEAQVEAGIIGYSLYLVMAMKRELFPSWIRSCNRVFPTQLHASREGGFFNFRQSNLKEKRPLAVPHSCPFDETDVHCGSWGGISLAISDAKFRQ